MASIVTSTGDEIATAAQWVYQTLKADTGPGGLFNPGNLLVSGVVEGVASRGQTYPYISMSYQGGVDIQSSGSDQIALSMLYTVKVVNNDESLTAVSPINQRIQGLLHQGAGEVGSGIVSACVREGQVSFVEIDAGIKYRHYGGHYRIMVQSN